MGKGNDFLERLKSQHIKKGKPKVERVKLVGFSTPTPLRPLQGKQPYQEDLSKIDRAYVVSRIERVKHEILLMEGNEHSPIGKRVTALLNDLLYCIK